MAKTRRVFLCRACGNAQSRWHGKCPDCGAWDSLEESAFDPSLEKDPHKAVVAAWGDMSGGGPADSLTAAQAVSLRDVSSVESPACRYESGIGEFDRVLGGGLVAGSAVLMGGEPGIGKSTLLLQSAFAWSSRGTRVLFVSSEESAQQVGLRATRLSHGKSEIAELFVLAETNLARIVEQARRIRPLIIVIDSVQMIYKSDLAASPGSITQLRRCCADLVCLAKASNTAMLLVGHVTKDGQLAGPRLLEHLVDCVVSFEGDRYHSYRVVRAAKNRFGTTLEIGLFEMTASGLQEVKDGAGVPASQSRPRPGSVVCPVMTGTRCLLVELQALTATGFLGAAKRKSSGIDANRLAMLIAVLEQHAELRLSDRDIFSSSVGGVRVTEPAADLALLLAIAGAHYRRALGEGVVAVGEVGLGGEVRCVSQMQARIREATRLGYRRLIVPRLSDAERLACDIASCPFELVEVADVQAAIGELG